MKNLKLVLAAILCMSITSITFASESSSYDIKPPEAFGLDPSSQGIDKKGTRNVSGSWMTADDGDVNALQSTWFDNGYGPGQLEWQNRLYQSELLSGVAITSGYMTNISYNWSGSFNGWNNVIVYLAIIDQDGLIVGSADVTNSSSGNLSVPFQEYPAYYSVGFMYIVDQQPEVMIYDGPFFGSVSATVTYQ